MIVLDENVYDPQLAARINAWYRGQVIFINSLRPSTLVKDDSIPTLLLQVSQPTFVTINVDDFWLETPAHPRFCIVAATLQQRDWLEVADWLRRCMRLTLFHTKAGRMGKVILLRPSRIEYYSLNRQVMHSPW